MAYTELIKNFSRIGKHPLPFMECHVPLPLDFVTCAISFNQKPSCITSSAIPHTHCPEIAPVIE